MNQGKTIDKEQEILEAAEKLFFEKGYTMTSTTDIAKEVGCNQALVHYYFRTKENLFNSIFEQRFFTFFQNTFEFQLNTDASFPELIRQIAEAHFDLLSKNPHMISLILNEIIRKPEHLKSIKNKLKPLADKALAQIHHALQREIDAGKLQHPLSVTDLVITMISLNAALFMLMPLAGEILELDEKQKAELIARRRSENVKVILRYLGY